MQFPFDVCEGYNIDDMIHAPKYQGGESISNMYMAPSSTLPIGIKSMKIDMLNEYITIEASAKVLLDNYFDGISINTFAQLIDTINSTGHLLLDLEGCYNYGRFLNIDTTNNVHMGGYNNDLVGNWNSIYPHLANAVNNPHFRPIVYTHKSNKGVAFMGDQKNEKNRLIAYCKHVELLTAKNKNFLHGLNSPMLMLNSAKDILRIEGNHTSFKSIKSRMYINDTLIKNVLSKGKNPNVWMLDKITQPDKENQLILLLDMYPQETYSFKEILELEGIKNIIRRANYNPKTIASIVKSYNCNFDYWFYGDKRKRDGWKGLRKYIPELKALDSLEGGKPLTNELILYIREQMINAA